MTLRINKLSGFILAIFFLVMGSGIQIAHGQDRIRVQGKITDISTGEPIAAVNVIEDGYVVSYSDIPARFLVMPNLSSIQDNMKRLRSKSITARSSMYRCRCSPLS